MDYETRYFGEGLQWNHIWDEYYDNQVAYLLMTMAASCILMGLMSLWTWPFFQVKDGSKPSLCYCLSPSYYKSKRARH
jgi:hypothetical protein